ncbi:MAG: hypothetical protein RJQ14_04215, partial [Marinoscillum sp.]
RNDQTMAVTRLERKGKRNKSRAKNRVAKIKKLNTVPTIKNVDIEEIKKSFEKAPAKKAEPKKEEAKVEAPVKEEAPAKEEKKETKAAAPKTKAAASEEKPKKKAAPKKKAEDK